MARFCIWADPLGALEQRLRSCMSSTLLEPQLLRSSTNVQKRHARPFGKLSAPLAAGQRLVVAKFSGADRFFHIDALRGRVEYQYAGQHARPQRFGRGQCF